MKRANVAWLTALLLAAAVSACGSSEPPPLQPSVSIAAKGPAEPAEPVVAGPVHPAAAPIPPLPATVRDERRFPEKSRALLVTEIQGLESLFAATPASSPDRPRLMRRIAESYAALVQAAERDRSVAPSQPEAEKANRIVVAGRDRAIKFNLLLAREHPTWCASPSATNPAASTHCTDEVLYYLGLDQERAGRLTEARKAYFELIRSWPPSKFVPFAYLGFGEMFLEEARQDPSKLSLAEQSYDQVIKYPPPDNVLYGYAKYRLGQVHARQGDHARATRALEEAIAHADNQGDAVLGELARRELHELEQRRLGL